MPATVDERARATLLRWRADPISFVRDEFQVEPDTWQLEALRVFPRVNRLAFKASKGVGKTSTLAWLIWNFLATRPHCRIAATSITGDNLSMNLWPELAKWQARSPYLSRMFAWTKTEIASRQHPATWWCQARTWPKQGDASQQAHALAGLHEDNAMGVLDESSEIPQAVMATVEAVLGTGKDTKVLQAGNPTRLDGPLYRACVVDRRLWHVITISGDPDNPKRSKLVDLEWARQMITTWGRDNPWVKINVLGEFPDASLNTLLGVEEVNLAMQRHLRIDEYDFAQRRLGIDVARFGDDRTVIFPRQGRACFRPRVMRHHRDSAVSIDIATAVITAKLRFKSEQEFIDATGGWAAGARDVLLDGGYPVYEVQFAAPALQKNRYYNRRAECWFGMAEAIKKGSALPLVPEMVPELTEPTYTFREGKFMLEPKDLFKARIGFSPDLADALATTYALPEMPTAIVQELRESVRAKRDRDPYEGEED